MANTLKYIWAAPNTLLGVIIALLHNCREFAVVEGVLEFYGNDVTLPIGKFPCITLGHTIIGKDKPTLDLWRKHEHVHVRQYEKFGPFMLPIFFLMSFVAWTAGLDSYYDNLFEVEAYRKVPEPKENHFKPRK